MDPERKQPASLLARERLQQLGAESLGDAELVALLLGTGTAQSPVSVVAADLLHAVGGLGALAQSGVNDLSSVRGLGVAKAARLLAGLELGRRLASEPFRAGRRLQTSQEVAAFLAPRLAREPFEKFIVLGLDARNRLLVETCVGTGGRVSCAIDAAHVFRNLVREGAVTAVAAHNHPSGDPAPSAEDQLLTQQLVDAGRILGIPIVDHVIIGHGRHFSFCDAGVLDV